MLPTAATRTNGIFSVSTRDAIGVPDAVGSREAPDRAPKRSSGYQSSTTRTTGKVTAITLERTAAKNRPSEIQYHRPGESAWRGESDCGAVACRRYARNDARTKNAHSTSRRSVAHATDSTRSGCTANSSAAKA